LNDKLKETIWDLRAPGLSNLAAAVNYAIGSGGSADVTGRQREMTARELELVYAIINGT
jgi:hypothetical protein